jgi:hypothetical protein
MAAAESGESGFDSISPPLQVTLDLNRLPEIGVAEKYLAGFH